MRGRGNPLIYKIANKRLFAVNNVQTKSIIYENWKRNKTIQRGEGSIPLSPM